VASSSEAPKVTKVSPDSKQKIPFRGNYKKANCCNRMFYNYSWNLIASMRDNNNKMEEEMIEDMTLTDNETEAYIERFLENIRSREAAMTDRTPGAYYYVIRNAVWATFRKDALTGAFAYFMGETCAIGYTSLLIYLINFLKDENATLEEGIILIAIFGTLMSIGALFKNFFVFHGYNMAKISRLSMQSLTETNSGKLITIVSGDIQAIERSLAITTVVIAAPFVNLVAYTVLIFTSGWIYAGITFGIWVAIMIMQEYSSRITKTLKGKESVCNDERQKLVNDMIIGARTIKSYGWENHYISKVQGARNK
jgi:ABC-type multidrug transport system fused ATPase/permease subunit